MEEHKAIDHIIPDFSNTTDNGEYHEGDILLFNTLKDKCMPSEFIGQYHIHFICYAGTCTFSMKGRMFSVKPDDLVIWQMWAQTDDILYSPDFDADFLLVSRMFLIENNPEVVWATKAYVYICNNPVFPLNVRDKELCLGDFRIFREKLSDSMHLFRREVLGKQMQIFLYDLWNIYARAIDSQQKLTNVKGNLFNRFMDLVLQYSNENREVAFYADKLCVTPKYLSQVSRGSSGYPASHWINGYATQQIVAMLKNPGLSIAEISDRMNFYTTSHFTRYVKKMLGVSPSVYRKQTIKKH